MRQPPLKVLIGWLSLKQAFIISIMSFFMSTCFSFTLKNCHKLSAHLSHDWHDKSSLAPGSLVESHGLQLGNHLYANGNEVYSIASIAICRNPESICFVRFLKSFHPFYIKCLHLFAYCFLHPWQVISRASSSCLSVPMAGSAMRNSTGVKSQSGARSPTSNATG